MFLRYNRDSYASSDVSALSEATSSHKVVIKVDSQNNNNNNIVCEGAYFIMG